MNYTIFALHHAENRHRKYYDFETIEEAKRFAEAEGMTDWADEIILVDDNGNELDVDFFRPSASTSNPSV